MATIKYPMTLSTTEPYNYVGKIKVRQADDNTQVFKVDVTENGQPKSFSGLVPFFCLLPGEVTGQGVSEEPVTSYNASAGTLEYTLSPNALQFARVNEAYFSFRKELANGKWIEQFSTKSFFYTVEKSIYTQPFKDSNYWFTFSELYRKFQQYIEDGKTSWEDFVESNREILESIDPGGKILTELIDARYHLDYYSFPTLKKRLDNIELRTTSRSSVSKIRGSNVQLIYHENETGMSIPVLMQRLKENNVNTISICPRFWADNEASEITGFRDSSIVTLDYINNFCVEAKKIGLKVMLKVHVSGEGFTNFNHIKPNNPEKFIDSYCSKLLEMFNYVKDYVDIISITNEMDNQSSICRDKWVSLIKELRLTKPDLQITNSSRVDDLKKNVFLDMLDYIGVNLYTAIGGDLDTPIKLQQRNLLTLTKSINKVFKKATELGKKVLVTECGCQPYKTALLKPESWEHSGAINYDYQIRYYDVVLKQLFKANQIVGTVIWQSAGTPGGGSFGWLNNPTESLVKKIYGGEV